MTYESGASAVTSSARPSNTSLYRGRRPASVSQPAIRRAWSGLLTMFWPSMMSFAVPPVRPTRKLPPGLPARPGSRAADDSGADASPELDGAGSDTLVLPAAVVSAAALLSGAARAGRLLGRRRGGRGAVVVAAAAGRQAEGHRHRRAAVQDLAAG